ncbi:ODR7 protein [Aphelenchoides avenae]|nr:ODR7 protein [Aphelenchus avenae]
MNAHDFTDFWPGPAPGFFYGGAAAAAATVGDPLPFGTPQSATHAPRFNLGGGAHNAAATNGMGDFSATAPQSAFQNFSHLAFPGHFAANFGMPAANFHHSPVKTSATTAAANFLFSAGMDAQQLQQQNQRQLSLHGAAQQQHQQSPNQQHANASTMFDLDAARAIAASGGNSVEAQQQRAQQVLTARVNISPPRLTPMNGPTKIHSETAVIPAEKPDANGNGNVSSSSMAPTMCHVCYSAPSNGLHFGARTCAACAAFFRRSISDNKKYVCKRSQRCTVRVSDSQGYRKICRNCRMKRCLEIGMLPENVQHKRHRRDFYDNSNVGTPAPAPAQNHPLSNQALKSASSLLSSLPSGTSANVASSALPSLATVASSAASNYSSAAATNGLARLNPAAAAAFSSWLFQPPLTSPPVTTHATTALQQQTQEQQQQQARQQQQQQNEAQQQALQQMQQQATPPQLLSAQGN